MTAYRPKSARPLEQGPGTYRPKSARPVDVADPIEAPEPYDPKDVGPLEAAGLAVGGGLLKGGLDEAAGAFDARYSTPEKTPGYTYGQAKPTTITRTRVLDGGRRRELDTRTTPQAALAPDEPQRPSVADTYRKGRDEVREREKAAEEQYGWAFRVPRAAADAASEAVLGVATGGASLSPAGQVITGGLAGFLGSDTDVTRGDSKQLRRAALDAGVSGGLSAATAGLGRLAGKAYEGSRLEKWVAGKLAEAQERAAAMAKEKEAGFLKELLGAAGGLSQKASRATETIRRVPGDELSADPAEHVGRLISSAEAAEAKAAALRQRATAHGVTEPAIHEGGALITKGSQAEAAQKALDQAVAYEYAGQQLRKQAERAAAGELPPRVGELRVRREAALAGDELLGTENNVLANALDDLPDLTAQSTAARAAYSGARETSGDRVAQSTADILSGRAAWQAAKDRIKRYGPTMAAGAATGLATAAGLGLPAGGASAIGAATALAAGGGQALLGHLNLPAVRSWTNLVTKYPAVTKWWATNLDSLLSTAPQSFGRYAAVLGREAQKGPEYLRAMDDALTTHDPDYADRVKLELTKQAAQNEAPEARAQ